jgi:hypothetical protein
MLATVCVLQFLYRAAVALERWRRRRGTRVDPVVDQAFVPDVFGLDQ